MIIQIQQLHRKDYISENISKSAQMEDLFPYPKIFSHRVENTVYHSQSTLEIRLSKASNIERFVSALILSDRHYYPRPV